MKLNELIELTYVHFRGKRKKHPIEKSFVDQVLKDAGIGQLLKESPTSQKASRLIIHRVSFRGYKWQEDQEMPFQYTRKLETGINGWVADNSRGKSTILKIIVWALTGIKLLVTS